MKGEFSGVLRGDRPWDLDKVVMYIGDRYPNLFVECFAGAGGTTLTLLLRNCIQRGVVVVRDPYLHAFWQEALKTDNLIRKVKEFDANEANIEDVVNNPDCDPAFWTLVKSRCSYQGRLDRKAFLEWEVLRHWKPETIIEGLLIIRSLSDRMEVTEERGVEVLETYDEATVLLHDPFDAYDKWNESLHEAWRSKQENEKLFQILASHKGRWIVLRPTETLVQLCQAKQVGAAWMVVRKRWSPSFYREPILVSDREFAIEQNDTSFSAEKQHQDDLRNE